MTVGGAPSAGFFVMLSPAAVGGSLPGAELDTAARHPSRASHEPPISVSSVDCSASGTQRRTRDDQDPSIHWAKFVE